MSLGPFDTETMAELYASQGRPAEAADIYRRLLETDREGEARREHRERRLRELAPEPIAEAPLPTPGLRLARKPTLLVVTWSLPEGTPLPTLEVLLVTRQGSELHSERRRVPLLAAEGFVHVPCETVVHATAAVGRLEGERFVPLALATAV